MTRDEFQAELAAIFSNDGFAIGSRVYWMDAVWGRSTGILTNWTDGNESKALITLDDARTRVVPRVRMWDSSAMANISDEHRA